MTAMEGGNIKNVGAIFDDFRSHINKKGKGFSPFPVFNHCIKIS